MSGKRNAAGNGSLRKRKDGLWEGRYSVGFDPKTGKQIQRSIYGKTQREVRQKMNEILVDINNGIIIQPTALTVGQWLDQWYRDYTANVRPATKACYEQHIRVHLKPSLGRFKLNKLTPQQIQYTYNSLLRERKLSPKTVRNIHGVLHKSLEQARKLGYLKINPSEATVLPRLERSEPSVMGDQAVADFLRAIEGNRYEKEMFVAVFTGLREGEVLGLTWDCIDFEHGTVLVNKQHGRMNGEKEYHFSPLKNSKPRILTPAKEVMDVLAAQREQQKQWAAILGNGWSNPENLVFTTEFGRYIINKTLYMNCKRIVRKLGMPDVTFHDLRHTFAVNSLRAGDDIKTLQDNLGHATASFTLSTYAHATPDMKRESADRMGKLIRRLTDDETAQNSSMSSVSSAADASLAK